MTKEELKQKLNNEASLYCQEYATLETYDSVHKAYIFSAESREKRIAELKKENEELKAQVNKWLNAYSDTSLVKVLRDCIYKNEKLSSQEQQQLSAWVECAMDFGSNLDECAEQLTKAKEKIHNLLEIIERPYQFNAPRKIQMVKEAEQFLNSEVEK